MSRGTWAFGACLLAAVLAGCGAGAVTGQSQSARETTSSVPGSSAAALSKVGAKATSSPRSPARGPARLLEFTTPTRNIACSVSSGTPGDPADPGQARCDIAKTDWSPPPRPASCTGDWGHSLTVGPDGAALGCVSDSTFNDNVVEYGTRQVGGAFSCAVDQSGVTCTDLDTGHGFAVSREQYGLF